MGEEKMDCMLDLKVGGLAWKGTLRSVSAVDYNSINEELCNQSGRVGFFGVLHAQATATMEYCDNAIDQIKENIKVLKARIFMEAKNSSSDKAPSDKICEMTADCHPQVIEALQLLALKRNEYVAAKELLGQINALVKALDHKRTSLDQLSNNIRKEQSLS